MPSHNIINVEFRIILNSVSRLHRDKVGTFSHPVHNNPYGVMLPPSLRKTNREVHINGLLFPSRNLNNLSKTSRIKMFCLNLLTIRTLAHIIFNVLLHGIPLIDLHKIMIHLGGTWMYGVFGTMGLCRDPGPQIIHIWYTQPFLVPKYAIISQSKRLIHLNQH
ncbi:hypothetical protein EJD97_017820 [Solanum chilense]|uniref:Uncharacterized protein n=1 Tax=Solanum chilense TaxID=4083 RepID=A0A6N2C7N7_SOLCI|nr:hypothetical protein EJD97_017820 [Solanum chilense]